VIAGASAFPNDYKEAAANFRIRGWLWWRKVMLPGIFPYYVTGAITASGGAWNASIVSEYVSWGQDNVVAHGLGAYIAQTTAAGDFPRSPWAGRDVDLCSGFQPRGLATDVRHG
jgi:NitT/TauT family transport system permease protein